MKITLEHYDQIISIEEKHDDLTLDEVMDMLRSLLLGAGFAADSIKKWFEL